MVLRTDLPMFSGLKWRRFQTSWADIYGREINMLRELYRHRTSFAAAVLARHQVVALIQTTNALAPRLQQTLRTPSGFGSRRFRISRPAYAGCKVGSYRSNDINHEELVEELLKAPYNWLLSEYEHPVYARLGRPFWRKEVQLRTTNFRDDSGKGRRVECFWRNF
jgi:hypothetical protein